MNKGKGAVTLVEILVVTALLSIVLIVAVSWIVSNQRRSMSLDFWAGAHQATQVLESRLRADFDSFVPSSSPVEDHTGELRSGITLDVVSGRSGPDGLPLGPRGRPLVDRVCYRFDRRTRRVLRNGEPVQAGPFERVGFSWVPSPGHAASCPGAGTLVVEVEVASSGGPGSSPGPTGHRARFTLRLQSPHLASELSAIWTAQM